MTKPKIIPGFSRLNKEQKLELISGYVPDSDAALKKLRSYWHSDTRVQKILDEFSENTLSNYFFPYGVAPNVVINGRVYMVPMVIEESSVIAAASNGAKFWSTRGGFHSEVLSMTKIGQVHFIWNGDFKLLQQNFDRLRQELLQKTAGITANMESRGGGILGMELMDKTESLDNYYQLSVKFDTRDSMGANFINSCLEEYAAGLMSFVNESELFTGEPLQVIMSILSNYTPECLVKTWVECEVEDFSNIDEHLTAEEFVWKFEKAVQISMVDVYRAATHNKGIFNGIDAVALATGNDFRAIEASGHAWAARNGGYKGLTEVKIENGRFYYSLTLPLSIGTVGGLTSLHPMAKFSLELLGNPQAPELMQIASAVGLANNFGAIRSLITKGIQIGHMKMHLLNILNTLDANEYEKVLAVNYFKNHKVSYNRVSVFLDSIRHDKEN